MQEIYDIMIDLYRLLNASERQLSTPSARSYEEDHGIDCLLRYINGDEKLAYEVVSRPDKVEHTRKRPDYVCKDRATGTELIVEITQIINHPHRLRAKAHRERIWYEIATRVKGKLPGAFGLTLPLELDTRSFTSQQLTTEVEAKAGTMMIGDQFQLSCGLRLSKIDDKGSFLLPYDEDEDENKDDPIELMTDDQIVRAIEAVFPETNEKFEAYPQGVRVLLLDFRNISCSVLDEEDALSLVSKLDLEKCSSIDRIYLLNTPEYGHILHLRG